MSAFFFFPLPTFREPSNCGMGGLKCHLRIFKHSGARGIGRSCAPANPSWDLLCMHIIYLHRRAREVLAMCWNCAV